MSGSGRAGLLVGPWRLQQCLVGHRTRGFRGECVCGRPWTESRPDDAAPVLILRQSLVGWALLLGLVSCNGTSEAPQPSSADTRSAVTPRQERTTTPEGDVRGLAAPQRSAPKFTFSSARLGPPDRRRVRGSSWHPGCPVGLDRLRLLRIGYWGFDRRPHLGAMIVGASAVAAVRRAFAQLFRARFPIRRMRLVDHYGGSDYASIEADNTSAFNCRPATGSSRWSGHAYGRAIDVNPIENPYVRPDGTTAHPASRPYLDRSHHRRGMAYPGGVLVRAFARAGWFWGGDWRPPSATDYQHFSATGR
jgi:hypothetical protein